MFKELVEFVVKALVDHPEEVRIDVVEDPAATTLKLHVAPGDLGRVIGKQGRTARAIRTLLHATAARLKQRVVLEIME